MGPDDPLMEATVRKVESELMIGRGMHRHPGDEFYGGGLWVILAGLLGWHYAQVGRFDEARAQLDWIAAAATSGVITKKLRIVGIACSAWLTSSR